LNLKAAEVTSQAVLAVTYYNAVIVSYLRFLWAALCNTAGHYIFALWFLLSSSIDLFFLV